MNERRFERIEQEPKVELEVTPPQGDKFCMIRFNAHTEKQARAYNEAVAHHLGQLGNIFHQIGGSDRALGVHGWELWDKEISSEQLEALLPEIERDAQILLTENDLDELYEKLYKRWDAKKKKT